MSPHERSSIFTSHYDSEFNDGSEEEEEYEEVGGVMCPDLEGDGSDGDKVAEDGDDHDDDVEDAESYGPACLEPGLDVELIIFHRPDHPHSFFVPFFASTSGMFCCLAKIDCYTEW